MNNGNGNFSRGSHPPVLRAQMQIGYLLAIFSSPDGKEWTRMNREPIQTDLPTTISIMQMEHAIHSPNAWLKIVDMKTGTTLHNQVPEVPPVPIKHIFPEIDAEERERKRNEWLARVLEWCMPAGFRSHAMAQPEETRAKLCKAFFKRHKIEVENHESGSCRVTRKGEAIAEWRV